MTSTFPSTRYRGSKVKLVDWLWDCLKTFGCESALDAFGGTGSVSYRFKQEGLKVTYNDLLPFNYQFGLAFVENDSIRLDEAVLSKLLEPRVDRVYPSWIQDTFSDIYYTEEENKWLDQTVTHLHEIDGQYTKALAFFALAQACLMKRPFNLFHRKNLYLRLRDVERSFGNKVSWDRPFPVCVRGFAKEANGAVFEGRQSCSATMLDASQVPGTFDLVYIDPPYMNATGSSTDYADLYHFLSGLLEYQSWSDRVDFRSKHRRMLRHKTAWTDKNQIHKAFDELFAAYPHSILAVSYRSDGIPSSEEMKDLLLRHRSKVTIHSYGQYTYALSTNQRSEELLFVAEP